VLPSGERAKNARSICLSSFWQHYLVAMATSLYKLENKVQVDYRHVKRFHMVKRLRNSVQCVRRYSTKYTEPRREKTTQFRLESSLRKILDRSFILHNVVALVALFSLAHTRRYPIPFLNDRAISAGG